MNTLKNNRALSQIWDVFQPFLLYYVVYSAVFLVLIFLCREAGQGGIFGEWIFDNADTVTELVSGVAMLTGILPLLPMLRKELAEHKRSVKTRDEKGEGGAVQAVVLTTALAVSSSLCLNVLLALTGMVDSSASYQDVARQQYGVVFGVGAVLFGLISPVTEEIVFRGLVFNRLRRYYPHMAAVVVSGVLFGIYHGNAVQGVYGGCMGILMAYLYERMHSFFIPCLFHGAANLTVYAAAQSAAVHRLIFTVPGCVIFLAVSAAGIFLVERRKNLI